MAKGFDNFLEWATAPKIAAGILATGFVLVSSAAFLKSGIAGIKKEAKMVDAKETITVINNEIFKEVYGDYEEYVSLVAKAIDESDMNNSSMEVYVAYQTMLDNGWLSYGDTFTKEDPEIEPTGNIGITVPAGQGMCRNIAFNLFKVFDALGYDAGVVYGYAYEDVVTGDDLHGVTYVREGNHLFLYDPMNNTIFLKDPLGRFISIDDDSFKFAPSMFLDRELNAVASNEVYLYIGEDYSSNVTYRTRRRRAREKVEKLGYYYSIYEYRYLREYEKSIVDSLDSYSEDVKRLLKERGESAVEIKFE